jgi:L,D-transpeptidase catalytic domain
MTSFRSRIARSVAPLALVALAAPGLVHAQGFSSVSAAAPAAVAAPAVPAPSAPAPVGTAAAQATPAVGEVAPAATLAAIVPPSDGGSTFNSGGGSFSSVSSGSPAVAATPGQTDFGAGSAAGFEMAEKVLVVKHERKLYLMRRGRVIAEYPIKLGLNPYGHKQREGDFRTPEGKYELVARNPRSEFFLSIKVSYPNREDAAVASEAGFPPGGLIMIHGQPNVPKKPPEHYATRDWTDGCIALSNADMVDVWLRTGTGIPIEIRP